MIKNDEKISFIYENELLFLHFNFRKIENKWYIYLTKDCGKINLNNIKYIIAQGNQNKVSISKKENNYQDKVNFLLDNDIATVITQTNNHIYFKLK